MTEQTLNGMKCKADFQFLLEQTEQSFLHHLCRHCTRAGNIWQQWQKANWIWSLYHKHGVGHMNPEKLPTHTSISRALMQNSNPARTWNTTDLSNAAWPALLERNALWMGISTFTPGYSSCSAISWPGNQGSSEGILNSSTALHIQTCWKQSTHRQETASIQDLTHKTFFLMFLWFHVLFLFFNDGDHPTNQRSGKQQRSSNYSNAGMTQLHWDPPRKQACFHPDKHCLLNFWLFNWKQLHIITAFATQEHIALIDQELHRWPHNQHSTSVHIQIPPGWSAVVLCCCSLCHSLSWQQLPHNHPCKSCGKASGFQQNHDKDQRTGHV